MIPGWSSFPDCRTLSTRERDLLENAYKCEGLSTRSLAIREYDGIVAFHRSTHVTSCDRVVYWFIFRPCEDLIKVEFRGGGKRRFSMLWQKFNSFGNGNVPTILCGRWAHPRKKLD